MSEISERLIRWLDAHGIEHKDAAAQSGIPIRSFARYTSGERSLKAEHVSRLTQLGINPLWLLTGAGDPDLNGLSSGRRPTAAITAGAARVDRELWRRVRSLVKDVYARQGVRLPENVMDDILVSKYNVIARMAPTPDALPAALAAIEAQILEEMEETHPDAASTKHRA